jgi:hypothetical protein
MRKEFLYRRREVVIEPVPSANSSKPSFKVWLDRKLLNEVTFSSVEVAANRLSGVIDANNRLREYH